VGAFATVWYKGRREQSAADHRQINAVLDAVVQRFGERDEEDREAFRAQLTAFRNLYAFLSQIIPYQDSELEKFYTFARNLISKLPPPGDGRAFTLDDEVALRFYRLQQMTDGSIDLEKGDAYPLKGPTDVGTGGVKDEEVPLSTLVDKLNDRFGTDFTQADQLFFDQIRVSAEENEKIVEAAKANNLSNFSAFLEKALDELFIDRMEGNEDIFSRVMTDKAFRNAAQEHLAREIFERVRGGDEKSSGERALASGSKG
jgi:type I restriction enzyme R subunit